MMFGFRLVRIYGRVDIALFKTNRASWKGFLKFVRKHLKEEPLSVEDNIFWVFQDKTGKIKMGSFTDETIGELEGN